MVTMKHGLDRALINIGEPENLQEVETIVYFLYHMIPLFEYVIWYKGTAGTAMSGVRRWRTALNSC